MRGDPTLEVSTRISGCAYLHEGLDEVDFGWNFANDFDFQFCHVRLRCWVKKKETTQTRFRFVNGSSV